MSNLSDNSKKNIRSWISNITIAILFFVSTASLQELFEVNSTQVIVRKLSDCFLVPGSVLGGIAGLCWIAAKGNFDMLSYGVSLFIGAMLHPSHKKESYLEYKTRKEEKNPDGTWPWRMLVVGLVCIALSVIFAILFEVL